ncbi:PoNe immunity protein domain-containing protein [Cupriavidus gilardii]|uniref:PoNe immunity protein domain-containing protein n=1 Tax=Cupriavidus gilardii TaxID=82541 RepID=UPI001FCA1CA0|nr:PoNe immunity protein domain-containing protein [Cupriavidus gilardii]
MGTVLPRSILTSFLKRWYKGLSGTAWHDTHKSVAQGGYYGYWSFEAGAAVLLLGIEDDTSLHSFPYYPKDLVAWAKANMDLGNDRDASATGIRPGAYESCCPATIASRHRPTEMSHDP